MRISCGFFTHRDMALYLSEYQRFHIHIASAILSQMCPIRMLSLYSFNEMSYRSYSAGCSSTRLINFSRYLSSITSLYINHHKSSTNKRRRLCNLRIINVIVNFCSSIVIRTSTQCVGHVILRPFYMLYLIVKPLYNQCPSGQSRC